MGENGLHGWQLSTFLQAIAGKSVFALTLMCLVATLPATAAHANTQQCNALNRQLKALPSGNSANYRKYDNAAKRQASELQKAKRIQSQANCNFLSGGKCSSLRISIRKMESNYRKLIATRDRYGNAGSSKRISIQRKIAALRCGTATKTVAASAKNRSKIIVRGRDSLRPSLSTAPQLGGFRTLCVRTCDGYYFPISHASTNGQLSRDESICQALCPAAESRLYLHRNTDQETEDMVSLRGQEPYTELPTAFKYRTQSRDPYCTCGRANPGSAGLALSDAQKLANITPAKPKKDEFLASLPAPAKRPNLFADAETQADEASGLTRQTIMSFVGQESGEMQFSSSNRKIRVVGPQYLPDPSTAIDLQAPAPTLVQ